MSNDLTSFEKKISKEASISLGFKVILYKDGMWWCDPSDKNKSLEQGSTYQEAIENCRKANSK